MNCCFRYHKGTDFQANHNCERTWYYHVYVVLDTTKVLIFKQITTKTFLKSVTPHVVLDTTKVLIFKQITTHLYLNKISVCCFRYHKGTDFQANHNLFNVLLMLLFVVLDTTKVLIFKQITTEIISLCSYFMLF